jgi:glutamate-1-semialdehyde 2,1-aminomutase
MLLVDRIDAALPQTQCTRCGYPDCRAYAQAVACDTARFNRFFHAMLARGVYLAPSAFEAGFLSMAHDEAVIGATVEAARAAFAEIG